MTGPPDKRRARRGTAPNPSGNYIREYGVRKVEANVLVVRPDAGQELCRQAIHQYLSDDAPVDYERKLEPHQVEVQSEIQRLLKEKDL